MATGNYGWLMNDGSLSLLISALIKITELFKIVILLELFMVGFVLKKIVTIFFHVPNLNCNIELTYLYNYSALGQENEDACI